jgi:hypothetical protein
MRNRFSLEVAEQNIAAATAAHAVVQAELLGAVNA